MRTNLNNIGDLLAQRRKEKGLTQSEAGALGVEPVAELQSATPPGKELIDYVMAAIIEFSHYHKLTIREASNYLNRFKGIDFLAEFYDVEHTLSFNDCVNDLTVVCRNNGGGLQ